MLPVHRGRLARLDAFPPEAREQLVAELARELLETAGREAARDTVGTDPGASSGALGAGLWATVHATAGTGGQPGGDALAVPAAGSGAGLGLLAERIRIAADDLGVSASNLLDRAGCARLTPQAAQELGGVALPLGVSRLSRKAAEWFGLLPVETGGHADGEARAAVRSAGERSPATAGDRGRFVGAGAASGPAALEGRTAKQGGEGYGYSKR